MNDKKEVDTKEEYIFETNEKQQKIIKTIDKEKNQEINIIFEKNADARIVINAVTVDSLVEIHNIIEKYSLQSEIIMASISVGESVGKHTIMKANNPVYVITIGRG